MEIDLCDVSTGALLTDCVLYFSRFILALSERSAVFALQQDAVS